MTHPTNAILERHIETLSTGRNLFVQPHDTEFTNGLSNAAIFTDDWHLAEQSSKAQFGRFPVVSDCDRVIVFCPRERERQEDLFATIASQAGDCEVWLVGALKAGIKAGAKRLDQFFENVSKIDSARHCAIFVATQARANIAMPNIEPTQRTVTVAGQQLELCSAPGVYGHEKVDAGTELLLENLPSLHGRVLDMGCGDGVIGAWLKQRQPELDITAVDCSAHAIASTQASFKANGLEATVMAADVFPPKPASIAERFNFIVCNPPFHRGVMTDYGVVNRLVTEARDHLVAGGQLWIVANTHLPYQPLLEREMGRPKVIKETTKFRVWRSFRQS